MFKENPRDWPGNLLTFIYAYLNNNIFKLINVLI